MKILNCFEFKEVPTSSSNFVVPKKKFHYDMKLLNVIQILLTPHTHYDGNFSGILKIRCKASGKCLRREKMFIIFRVSIGS